ncbi:YoeB toxin protein [Roseovarius sp. AK1035]|nr:YoeB toxin protein [Roseovarius sp. AK1035]
MVFSDDAWEDFLWWQSTGRDKGLNRVIDLINATKRLPFKGIGKPEPLKGDLTGWWSRRITDEHRFVYRVSGKGESQQLDIAQLRYHY